MKEVLIVARTKTRNSHCIGGVVLCNKQPVRLCTKSGRNQSPGSKMKIGQIWNINFGPCKKIKLPHSEDVCVLNKKYMRDEENLKDILMKNCPIWKTPHEFFDGLLQYTDRGRPYIKISERLPQGSTGLWKASENISFQEDNIYLFKEESFLMRLKYTGLSEPINIIPKDALVRLSLARWWRPKRSYEERKCYLNISGWYL